MLPVDLWLAIELRKFRSGELDMDTVDARLCAIVRWTVSILGDLLSSKDGGMMIFPVDLSLIFLTQAPDSKYGPVSIWPSTNLRGAILPSVMPRRTESDRLSDTMVSFESMSWTFPASCPEDEMPKFCALMDAIGRIIHNPSMNPFAELVKIIDTDPTLSLLDYDGIQHALISDVSSFWKQPEERNS
eukprot:TRINITY_DN1482_c0_g1_i8.p2 TRINITY_DN1482_c0_g1~~TRINITY_DN1482_c0_g1_i8.p2  ORF type:complete len:187 (+),score=29.88 TRINITY_DN1482_c0_g1_i8:878-1438(+)